MDKTNFRSVLLTERDRCVLRGLYDNVVMSFPQISSTYFAGCSKPTVINRLSRLYSAGLIQKFKVPRLELIGAKSVVSVVFQISRAGILALRKRHPETDFRSQPIRLRPFSIDHDLLLVDVVGAMKIMWPSYQIIIGELFSALAESNSLRPDAVIIKPGGAGRIAVELELTAKSEQRYRDLALKYRLSKELESVIYVTAHDQVAAKIKTVVGGGSIGSRFEFMSLADVLNADRGGSNNLKLTGSGERKGCLNG